MKPFKRIATVLGEILLGLGVIWVSRVIPNFVFEGMENIENIYITLVGSKHGGAVMDVYLISDPLMFWSFTILFFGLGVWFFIEGVLKLTNYRKTSKKET